MVFDRWSMCVGGRYTRLEFWVVFACPLAAVALVALGIMAVLVNLARGGAAGRSIIQVCHACLFPLATAGIQIVLTIEMVSSLFDGRKRPPSTP